VGYVDFGGNMDTCIALRTLVLKGQTAYLQAGAGIVADSGPEREDEETLNKARGLLRAPEMAETQPGPLPPRRPACRPGREGVFSSLMSEVSRILSAVEQGDAAAAGQLLPLVYDELRKLAVQKLAQEKPGQTLEATALVHEAYLRLVGAGAAPHWNGRGHF